MFRLSQIKHAKIKFYVSFVKNGGINKEPVICHHVQRESSFRTIGVCYLLSYFWITLACFKGQPALVKRFMGNFQFKPDCITLIMALWMIMVNQVVNWCYHCIRRGSPKFMIELWVFLLRCYVFIYIVGISLFFQVCLS